MKTTKTDLERERERGDIYTYMHTYIQGSVIDSNNNNNNNNNNK
jgi:hypothetical protein